MEYNEFEKQIITGHDVEFEYNNNKYSIIKTPDGFQFSEISNKDSIKLFTNVMELLIKVKIDGKFLKDISKNMKNIQVY